MGLLGLFTSHIVTVPFVLTAETDLYVAAFALEVLLPLKRGMNQLLTFGRWTPHDQRVFFHFVPLMYLVH